MWTRSGLKRNAKNTLFKEGAYWSSFLVLFLGKIISYAIVGILVYNNTLTYLNTFYSSMNYNVRVRSSIIISPFLQIPPAFSSLIVLVFSIFVINPLIVGLIRYLLKRKCGECDIKVMFSGFEKNYLNTVKVMFLRDLFMALWTLLGIITFFIPTIIFSYRYRMIPYIIAQNPDMNSSRVFELTHVMTKGDKFNIFVLDLSFLGWMILAVIPFGLGFPFLTPYVEMTNVELFLSLRDRTISEGDSSDEEFPAINACDA